VIGRLLPAIAVLVLATASAAAGTLGVCADPNNLPFSNDRREGYENRIAELVAHDMGREVQYTWWAQRRGFVRRTLKDGLCEVVMGVPASMDMFDTTRPYYRSSYVFLTRQKSGLDLESLDDPRLRWLRVGVQLIGDDGANTPPAHALARRGIISNVRGYMIYGDYRSAAPTAEIVDAVARGDIDVALVWGPQAAYFSGMQREQLVWKPVKPWLDGPRLPMVFDISMGVLRGNGSLRAALDKALQHRQTEVEAILDEYRVPRVGDH
jgi:mxaJ protein